MIELPSHITFKDGTENSDSEGFFDNRDQIEKYIDAIKSGDTGFDIDSVETISFFDEDGNDY